MAHPDTTKPKTRLGPPRLFIEVIREIDDGSGQYVRSRKEIGERVWRDAKHGSAIIENEINTCFRECEYYDR